MMQNLLFVLLVASLFQNIIAAPTLHHADPEIYQNVTEILLSKGYPAEYHSVVTKDGYILGVQRIPHGRSGRKYDSPGKPVILQHGLLDSAHTWINNLENESLGFILADAGYDVWLSNSRGNTYSKNHIHLTPKDAAFWDFSWDEMADYDLPAVINYVLNVTDSATVAYVGHSQGTEIAFAKLNADAELRKAISLFVALGPVANLTHIESPIKYVAPFADEIELVVDLFGKGEFLPSDWLTKFLARFLCGNEISSPVCSNVIFLLCGYDKANTNETRVPVYVAHAPAGTSVQNVVHYSQTILSKQFRRFDFGKEGNLKHYGQPTPPLYGLANLTVPTAVFYGGNDWLADKTDAEDILSQLPNLVYTKYIDYYNHLDFVWAVNSADVVYADILKLLQKYI